MNPITAAERVSKQFRIGTANSSYQTLRDVLVEVPTRPLRNGPREASRDGDILWALRDVNFEDNLMKM